MEVDLDRPQPFPNKKSTKVLITQPFFELQILHGSSYGMSDKIKTYKSALRTKVQKY